MTMKPWSAALGLALWLGCAPGSGPGAVEGPSGSGKPSASLATESPESSLPRFVRLEPGRFLMGSPLEEARRDEDEIRHEVTLTRSFLVAVTETTQGQWRQVMEEPTAYFQACGDDCPVERVSWFDAVAFANRLSQSEGLEACYVLSGCTGTPGGGCPDGKDWCEGDYRCDEVELVSLDCPGFRLPTEAEWEYAARAGTNEPTWAGAFAVEALNSAPALDPLAWYGGNSRVSYRPAWDCSDWNGKQLPAAWCGPHPVAGKAPNPWGLYDMLGNVWEWTWDWKGDYSSAPVVDPLGPESGTYRIRRGCSWANIPEHCRAADRSDDPPEVRDRNWGFRLVRSIAPPSPQRAGADE